MSLDTDALDDLIAYLDGSPSPWHAAQSSATRLEAAGFAPVPFDTHWSELPDRGYTVRGGALVAWHRGSDLSPTSPFRIAGAHTDSPTLRVKPRPDIGAVGWRQLGVEIYGGVLLNSWLDRDLAIAGRLVLRSGDSVLVHADEPVARIPQLAIHLDREVNERGLVLDKQAHLSPVWGIGAPAAGGFQRWIASKAQVTPSDIVSWDLSLVDHAKAAVLGADQELLASGRLDNQVSCWAATRALCTSAQPSGTTSVIALFDHEEVGSESVSGAAGPLLEHTLERLSAATGASRSEFLTQLAASTCISCDNAHSVHPNYAERHDPDHRPMVNQGPAIKLNHNQRYATSVDGVALAQRAFEAASVPWQVFVSRNNMPCGSTIGPITAARLGIETVDVGVPQLSMHSARELCGTRDPQHLATALRSYFTLPL